MLLKEIEKQPKLYVGDDGIWGLRHYLCGYVMAMQEMDSTYGDWLFSDFTVFLVEKYQDERSVDWATLIHDHESSGDNLKAFFRLIQEYKENWREEVTTVILETKRLLLRELEQEDFTVICRLLQDAETMYAYEHAFSDAEVQDWLDRQRGRYAQYGFGLWAVVEKKSGEIVGQCGLTMQDCGGREVLEVGYLLERAHWHKGYATEAAMACKEYAFSRLGAEEVYSIIRDNNLASQAVARRNGMTAGEVFVKRYHGVDMPHIAFSVKRG